MKDKEQIKECLHLKYKMIGQLQKECVNLESQLSEKPELRHGDYGLNYGFPRIVINEHIYEIKKSKNICESWALADWKNRDGWEYFGNLFDDLAAYAEDIEEFRLCTVRCEIIDKYIEIDGSHYTTEKVAEFHRKLGAMLATAKRKARE